MVPQSYVVNYILPIGGAVANLSPPLAETVRPRDPIQRQEGRLERPHPRQVAQCRAYPVLTIP